MVLERETGFETRDIQLGRLTLCQLSYSRIVSLPPKGLLWWRVEDLNLRRLSQPDLTVCPLWPLGKPLHIWSWRWDSNPQPLITNQLLYR